MSEAVGFATCRDCGRTATQDYSRKQIQRPVIDGEHSGYYPPETGFPIDPKNPAKRICPPKNEAVNTFKRVAAESKGAVVVDW